ncbi:hypothetical protein P170DRAFT_460316 [Aspergillus steynii IBT 23096]|uniref:Xylanolytic transcriptional activator regulatory domain-containing protein n=1 Tax=Aspergillus steynii IBT 23096 TaxID=1392250 RepID=A0A2I2GMF4_9EURO|nr:uncharacterized protein P170DRAFT_460316 [Aspergillus steynii IBT 23096]PLB54071.1 hypothetical protein P170DRAFT_460316 [Aspergillus steynii IBT 23096]
MASDRTVGRVFGGERPASVTENQNPALLPTAENVVPHEESDVTGMGLVSRPLNSDRPTRGFFGDSSTIAFLKELQDTFRSRTSGPLGDLYQSRTSGDLGSPRTHSGGPQSSHVELLPPRPLSDHLVDCYFSKIHVLYPFVHREAFYTAYEALWEPDQPPSTPRSARGLGLGDENVSRTTFYYALNAIFATGCQFSDIVRHERQTASEAFFQRSKPALDVDYLEAGDLALTQTLLLLTHYVQSSQTPNRSWHAVGMTVRLAQGIGLHSDVGNDNRSFAEVQIRRRVWHACVMLDLAVSIILGRPVMISQAPSTSLPAPIDDCYLRVESAICEQPPGVFSRVEWFIATLKLYDILRRVLNSLYDNYGGRVAAEPVDRRRAEILFQIQSVTQLDAELEDFRHQIPAQLCWDAPLADASQDPFLREKYLLQARFLYLKILVCRPVLSQSLRETYLSEDGSHRPGKPGTGIYANFTKDCSTFYVQAAISLISLVHETCSTELASVWFYNVFYVFTAASIIILADLHPYVSSPLTPEDLNVSWEKSLASLDYLKSYSSLAERCANSLRTIRYKCSMAASDQMPFSEDLFRDLEFDDQTLFDPFWFNMDLEH